MRSAVSIPVGYSDLSIVVVHGRDVAPFDEDADAEVFLELVHQLLESLALDADEPLGPEVLVGVVDPVELQPLPTRRISSLGWRMNSRRP